MKHSNAGWVHTRILAFFSCRGVNTFGMYPDKYMHMTTSHEIYERALRSIFTRQKIGLLILNICLFVKRVCSQNWSCTLLEKKQWMLGNGKCDLNRKFTMQGNYKYKKITEIKSSNMNVSYLRFWLVACKWQIQVKERDMTLVYRLISSVLNYHLLA